MNEEYIEGFCEWLRIVKNIKKIDILEMIEYVPEYEEYLLNNF